MNNRLIGSVLLALTAYVINASGYEQATHARITQFAVSTSILASGPSAELSSVTQTLGLDSYSPLGNGIDYLELRQQYGSWQPVSHKRQDYELNILKALRVDTGVDPIRTWLMFGAIREDDNMDEDPPTPRDIYPPLSRPLSHFYDPYNNRKLNSLVLNLLGDEIARAPDWAMGSKDIFAQPNTPLTPRYNTFTVFDAREAMLRALTLKSYDGSAYVDVAGTEDPARRQELRRMYWATAFRALGDVLHVNQDMAQPQHTRNEPHAGKFCSWTPGCPGGHSSVYEKYVNARALNATAFELKQPYNTTIKIWPLPLTTSSYPIPAFPSYADYWSTATGSASLTGKGLANYTNQGFFSSARNFGSGDYPAPPSRIDAYAVRIVPARGWNGIISSDPTPTYVYFGSVSDAWQGTTATDVPLTTFGLWDQFLQNRGALPKYTLNRLNYDAMADLLIPRAVAYSAGLINYFFRGVLEIGQPDEGVFALADHADPKGFTKIRAKVRNQTPTFVTPDGAPRAQGMDGGDLIAVIRYHKDLKYAPGLETSVGVEPCADPLAVIVTRNLDATTECRDGVEQIIVSPAITGVSLAQGSEQLVEFDFSEHPIPFAATDVILQVVYRGGLGSETNAVAVGSVDLSEPTYFTYQNATDYVHIDGHVYTRADVEKDLRLLALVQPRYCVDERVSPPVLRPECLQPFTIDLAFAFDDLADPLAVATEVPHRRLVRFAYLTVADEGAAGGAKAARSHRLKVQVQPHGSSQKALLKYEGTCLPNEPFPATPRVAQVKFVTWQQFKAPVSRLEPLRGVNGWTTSSCVVNGSDAIPGTPDDRREVMAPLTPDSDETKPLPVTIMTKYLSDAN